MKILKDKIDLCICSKSEGVYIPYWVFKLNKEKIAFFLKNLFDGDGGCYYQYDENRNRHKMSVEYDSKSIILIKQIQFLLMKFGILGNISSRIIKNLKYYRIHITGEYVEKFYSIINFDNNYKKEKLEKMQGNNLYYKTKLIPFINRDILRNICTSTGDFYMYFKEQNFTNNTINKFLDWIKTENIKKKYNIDNEIKKLETIKDRNLIYIRVEKIEEIYVDEYIYDLEVDIYHNYWAESFLTHNTLSSLATVKYYNKKAFLIVPKSLVIQWKNEILKWKVTTEDKIFVFTDNKSRNLEFRLRDYDFYIMNYEKVNFLSYEEFDKKTKEKYWTDYESELFKEIKKLTLSDFILVYDEMYKIKNYKSGVYKAHKKFRNLNWSGIIGLTGTPMENSLYEFYTILNFIKPNTISFMDMEKYFVFRTGYGPVIFRNLGKFNRMASKIMYRVNRDEVKLSLPKVTQEYRFLEASKDAQDMKSKLLRNAPSLFEIYSLLRVLDSYLDPTNEESKYFPLIKKVEQKNKLEELLEIIEEIGEKQIVIFTSYEKTCVWLYDQLKDKFKCKWVSSKTKDVNEIKEEFITGDIQVLICTDTLAYGTNFNQIDYLVNWDIHPNPARMQQRANRIVRIDSVNPKLIISLVSNIIEKDIYELIRDKIEKFELTVEGTDEKHLMSEIAKRWGIK
jgi:superfamily II DNA or RNA helicase